MKIYALVIIAAVVGALVGSIFTAAISGSLVKTEADYIRDFYYTENAVHVSPHSIRGRMDKGINDFVLVDLRSREEYEEEHIIGAVSIPAYEDRNTPAYEDTERIISSFRNLPEGKDVIVYCYSMPCMTGRKVGKMLADNDIFVKHLGIGWNEWRYFWNLWNHEHEWNMTDVEDYIASGPEPGVPALKNATAPCGLGEFGC
ncbi:MAG: rhodanese-like domain-containing protein [Candidatus Aenigmarchaeota archaeon]|nr:rhodanese-like domain-containing protein [Candidatus Aenigmarchaeota archaeon]